MSPTNAAPPPRPMAWVGLAWIAGLVLGYHAPVAWGWLGAGIAACLAAGGRKLWRSRRIRGPVAGSGAWLVAALLLAGWIAGGRVTLADRLIDTQLADVPADAIARVSGRVAEEPIQKGDSWQIVLRDVLVEPIGAAPPARRLAHDCILFLRGKAGEAFGDDPQAIPLPGQAVRARGKIAAIGHNTTPKPFDARLYWRSRGIGARMSVQEPEDLELGMPPPGAWPAAAETLREWRGAIGRTLDFHFPPLQAALARGLLLGEAERLNFADREAFRVTGLAHIMAVSGFNTGLVLLLILGIARALGRSPRECAWIGIACITFYAALTGFKAPVNRAALMGSFLLLGFALGRQANNLAALMTAAFVSLALEPRNLIRLDWQLSYTCVLAIMLLGPALYEFCLPRGNFEEEADREPPTLGRRLFNQLVLLPLVVTFAVQLGLLPIQLYHFRQFNLLLPVANVVGILASSVALIFIALTALVGWLPGVLAWLGLPTAVIASVAMETLMVFVYKIESWRFSQVTQPPLPVAMLFLYFATLLGGRWLRAGGGADGRLDARQRRGLAWSLALVFLIIAWAPMAGWLKRDEIDLYMLDVGQGDALVARGPNGKVMVIDAGRGGTGDQGQFTVGPFLDALGVSRIDCLVATHADADHVGGMPWLIDHYEIGAMLIGPDTGKSQAYAQTRERLAARPFPIYEVGAGARVKGFEPLEIELHGPIEGMNDNNASIVAKLTHGGVDLLMTGDLEAEGEAALIEAGLARDIEVLKVGHHGSRDSSSEAFIAALKPEAGLISVGRFNRYGHPAPEVLRRLEAHDVEIYRTDRQGTIWVRSDGERVRIYRFMGNR